MSRLPDDCRTALTPRSPSSFPLALYVHWPFCASKCPYCDFNSHVRAEVDQVAWREALLADLDHEHRQWPDARLGSIFFGGGTPSLMPPQTVAAVIDRATALWPVDKRVEITLEGNPNSAEAARFADIAAAGVNRVSLGLQALDDAALTFLGRAHDVREGLAALDIAQHRFARVSFDLIYARPGQSVEAWRRELERALAFGAEHLSLYQLTIEPGTRFETLVRTGQLAPLDPDDAADLFDLTDGLTRNAGLPAYETSNHARRGAESRHNLTYWRYQPYVGIGPGAHGRRGGMATRRHRKPENWLAAVRRNGHGLAEETPLSTADRSREALLMGLRLNEGLALTPALMDQLDAPSVVRLAEAGLLVSTPARLTVAPAGRLLLDAILGEIVR